jgi:hypothetical protein
MLEDVVERFAEDIYVRTRHWRKQESEYNGKKQYVWFGEIESVWYGEWKDCHLISPDGVIVKTEIWVSTPCDLYYTGAPITIDFVRVNDNWAKAPVKSLLMIGKRREQKQYYIPRKWNKSGPWISHEELSEYEHKYSNYCYNGSECLAKCLK